MTGTRVQPPGGPTRLDERVGVGYTVLAASRSRWSSWIHRIVGPGRDARSISVVSAAADEGAGTTEATRRSAVRATKPGSSPSLVEVRSVAVPTTSSPATPLDLGALGHQPDRTARLGRRRVATRTL
jgi:hypothetical protein